MCFLFELRKATLYRLTICGRWNATYNGKTCRHLNIRIGEHSGVSPESKTKTTTAIKDHMLFHNHAVSLDFFRILGSSNSEFYLNIKESLLISRDKPELNRNEKSSQLYLFD